MLFNSLDFAIFLPIIFLLYWFVTNNSLKLQNSLIVVSSYIFYGYWDMRFLSLIFFSTLVDYYVGRKLSNEDSKIKRRFLLWISILVNLGFLGFFKYYNFFLDNFITAFSFFGKEIRPNTLNIILPVGISFYTFQTLSYTIDVYKQKLKPTRNFISFAAFVSFFPQLVAGPIERASNLLPQFYKKRVFNYTKAVDGLKQILWGLFKKVVIADNAAEFANNIFNNYEDQSGSTLLLGGVFFAFQIYGDFSGYSDIAIGTSRLFGFNLKQNFAFPYFSRDIAEFWRRWHISLSTWFRDYVYIPLGGSRGRNWMKIKNIFIIFIVSGFWHGANWTFIFWGALNAIYFLPLMLLNKNRINTNVVAEGKMYPSIKEFFKMLVTFFITVIAWIFFRSENINMAFDILNEIFSYTILFSPMNLPLKYLSIAFLFFTVEWIQRSRQHALEFDAIKIPGVLRYSIYYMIIFLIIWKGGNHQDFIYFQF